MGVIPVVSTQARKKRGGANEPRVYVRQCKSELQCVGWGGCGGADSGRVLAEQQLLRNARFTFQFRAALPRSPHACSPARLTGDTVLLDKGSCSRKTHPAIIFSNSTPSDDPYGGQSHT